MYARATSAYRDVAVQSAPPPRVLEEVFARLLRDCDQARAALARGDLGAKGQALGHALELVAALSAALDHHAAPELCARLQALYRFVRERLQDANLRAAGEPITDAEAVIAELRAAFAAAGTGIA